MKADLELRHLGYSPQKAGDLLKPARDLLIQSLFWQHQRQGLAVLLSPENFKIYHLPYRCKEIVVVSSTFHIKPLIPLTHGDDRYYLLAISQNDARLFAGTRYTIEEIEIEGKPTGLQEALRLDFPEKHLQYHTKTASAPGASERPARFHGQGLGANHRTENLLKYFRLVDARLRETLREEQKAPMLLACVDYLGPIYREANSYPNLSDEMLSGNPDKSSTESLRHKAWGILEPQFLEERQRIITSYLELAARDDKTTTTNIEEIVRASWNGSTGILFASIDDSIWGSFDPEQNRLIQHHRRVFNDCDLLNYAAAQTLQHGGTVYAIAREDIPANSPAAAILRYPLHS